MKENTTELTKLEDKQIERLDETEEEIILQISLKRKMHNCPRCKAETDQVHDYRIRAVRDLSIRGKPLKLLYRRCIFLSVMRQKIFGGLRIPWQISAFYLSGDRKDHAAAASQVEYEGHCQGYTNLC